MTERRSPTRRGRACLEYIGNRLSYTPDWDTGCWNWRGQFYPNGYGKRVFRGRGTTAHRVMYENLVGLVPSGLELDHLCRNRACVNPIHLEPVTRVENIRRGTQWAINTARRSTKTTGEQRRAAVAGVLAGDALFLWADRLGVNAQNVEKWVKSRGYAYRPLPLNSFTGNYRRTHRV